MQVKTASFSSKKVKFKFKSKLLIPRSTDPIPALQRAIRLLIPKFQSIGGQSIPLCAMLDLQMPAVSVLTRNVLTSGMPIAE